MSDQTDTSLSPPPSSGPVPAPPATNRQRFLPAAGITLLGLSLLVAIVGFLPPGDGKRVEIVTIPVGASAHTVASILKERGVIRSATLFSLMVRITGRGGKLRSGVYRFDDGAWPSTVADRLAMGDVYVVRFSVPEGYSIFQLAELFEGKGLGTAQGFLDGCRSPEIREQFGIAGETVEGYLAPMTYDVTPGTEPQQVIRGMIERFMTGITPLKEEIRASSFSLHQIVTLASMIEREAVRPEEHPLIAAVFLNRLRRGMRLQSDPTAVYGRKVFGGTVTAADVRTPTPYNTYTIDGLPPGPIGNPSLDAIRSVLHPADVPYLYFVARKDGSHHFSTTLEEHNRAVKTWLR